MDLPRERKTLFLQKIITARYPETFLCWSFYAFVFLIPFEALNIGIEIRNVTISKLMGFVFLGLALLQPRVCFKPPGSAFIFFSGYILIYALLGVVQEEQYERAIVTQLFTIVQLLVLFWICKNLMVYENISRTALLTLGVSCLCLAVMVLLGILGTEIAQDRVTAKDLNANTYSALLSLGVLALVGLATNQRIINYKIRALAWLSFGLLAVAIVRSGSRGSMAVLLVAFLVLMFKGRRLQLNLRALLLVLLAVGVVIVAAYQSEAVRVRWERTFSEGETAGRDKIYSKALDMVWEKPFLGWGPITFYHELGHRLGKPTRDPHNIYFWIVLEVGLLGAVPFFMGLWLCWRIAWNARGGIHGQLPIAMLVFMLLISFNGSHHQGKLFWLVLAYAMASGNFVRTQKLVAPN